MSMTFVENVISNGEFNRSHLQFADHREGQSPQPRPSKVVAAPTVAYSIHFKFHANPDECLRQIRKRK